MKTTDLSKKQALCEELNMNLDEANELFETETLESMQMAQINGGTWPGWKAVWDFITSVSSFTQIWDWAKETFSGTPDPQSGYEMTIKDNGEITLKTTGAITETIIIRSDSITKNGRYGESITFTPTPVPKN